ncbi:signal peptidase II [Peribacillus sp. SCS-37]|uniref:signal peptidase II n=1 Tax=Paraperibacillus esterisolvens TaxID=3115296 RepID=UPI00390609F0
MGYFIVALFVIALDQFTKWLIVKNLELGESIEVISQFFYITSHRNRGAAWGVLEGQMWFFYIITLVVVAGLIYYIVKHAKNNVLLGVSLGLMLGGAVGNFIDRVWRREVVDFIHVYIVDYSFPVFNIADSALCIGVVMLIIYMLIEEKAAKEKENA